MGRQGDQDVAPRQRLGAHQVQDLLQIAAMGAEGARLELGRQLAPAGVDLEHGPPSLAVPVSILPGFMLGLRRPGGWRRHAAIMAMSR
jgi:hypothetical protein